MVVAPAAAARQWTDHLGKMVLLSGFFGALAGVSGALVSSYIPRMPTGPTIVVCVSAIVAVSLLLAGNRGLVWNWARERRNRRRLQIEAVLSDLYILSAQHPGVDRGHGIEVLRTMAMGHGGVDRTLKELEEKGLARRTGQGAWLLTEKGLAEAGRLSRERESKS